MKLTNREMIRTEAEVMAEIRRSMAEMPPTHTAADVFAEVHRLMEYAYGPEDSAHETGITEHSNYACGCVECTDMRERFGGGRVLNTATGEYEWMDGA